MERADESCLWLWCTKKVGFCQGPWPRSHPASLRSIDHPCGRFLGAHVPMSLSSGHTMTLAALFSSTSCTELTACYGCDPGSGYSVFRRVRGFPFGTAFPPSVCRAAFCCTPHYTKERPRRIHVDGAPEPKINYKIKKGKSDGPRMHRKQSGGTTNQPDNDDDHVRRSD